MSREVPTEVFPAPSSTQEEKPGCSILIALVVLAWAVEGVDMVTGGRLEYYGIRPRTLTGLPGVVLSPWLHGGIGHLIANSLTFLALGFIVLLGEGRRFLTTTLVLVVISGLGTWLIGRNAIHIGASGLIYGYFGYILGRAIWERRAFWAISGILVGVFYGSMIWGVFSTWFSGPSAVSWEGHLAGLIAGVWLGRTHATERSQSVFPKARR